jgi:hypothetical protein
MRVTAHDVARSARDRGRVDSGRIAYQPRLHFVSVASDPGYRCVRRGCPDGIQSRVVISCRSLVAVDEGIAIGQLMRPDLPHDKANGRLWSAAP